MFWIALYGIVALAVAVIALLVAEWVRDPGAPAPEHPGFFAALAGLLWPALLIGIAELAVVCCAGRRFRQAPQFEVVSSSLR